MSHGQRAHVQISCVCAQSGQTAEFEGFGPVSETAEQLERNNRIALEDATKKARKAGWKDSLVKHGNKVFEGELNCAPDQTPLKRKDVKA